MSLEDQVAALTDAVTALTDSMQHLAATMRGAVAPLSLPAAPEKGVVDPAEGKPAAKPKAKIKEPPASPAETAAATTTRTATPASAPAAAAGSPELTYADLADVVPKVAEKHGRAKAVDLFAQLGVSGGKQLQADFPKKIPEAVRLFRAALAE